MIKRTFNRLRKKSADDPGIIPKKTIAKYLPKNPVIAEAGAHVGVDTAEMAKLWPLAEIHAFEPVPAVYEQLVNNIRGYDNVTTYQLALSTRTGKQNIFISGGRSDGSSSLLRPKEHLRVHPDVSFDKTLQVKTITLKDWIPKYKIRQPDFLWLDLQGLELAVMKASPSVIRNAKVIYTEASLIETYENTAIYKDIRDWLAKQGFKPVIEKFPWEDMGNVLFIKK